jgi:peptidoglycan/xylan/chitin deacetylase (PgdA/CDA1 family)
MRAVSLLFHDVYVDDPAESGFVSDAADRYKLRLPDFDAQLDRVGAVRADAPLAQPPLRSGAHAERPWMITFDDGGVSYHSLIAERLEARGWRGHCFVTTGCIGRRGFLDNAQIRDLDARGHVIGSHSATHPTRFSACSYQEMVAEWRNSRQALEDVLGHAVRVASVPGGYFSPAVARSAQEAGLSVLFTSEPVTTIEHEPGFTLVGRFTIRRGDADDAAMRFVAPAPWARVAAWTSWNAKGVIKPLLGPSYSRVADWLCSVRRPAPSSLVSSELRRGRSS